jgi:hypothetical protein
MTAESIREAVADAFGRAEGWTAGELIIDISGAIDANDAGTVAAYVEDPYTMEEWGYRRYEGRWYTSRAAWERLRIYVEPSHIPHA